MSASQLGFGHSFNFEFSIVNYFSITTIKDCGVLNGHQSYSIITINYFHLGLERTGPLQHGQNLRLFLGEKKIF